MPKQASEKTTHFGYTQIPVSEKADKVRGVFDSVASKYDLMNDVMSLGIHRLWKAFTIQQAQVKIGQQVLDIAAGTGDLAAAFSKSVGSEGQVILADINATMLNLARDQLIDQGIFSNVSFVQANAECLPFPEQSFDLITIAFGLRNVTHISKALQSMYCRLRPGGCCLILEFSHPNVPLLKPIYDFYSFKLLPTLGEWIAQDRESYQYLAESIRMHPDQKTLKKHMEIAGFDEVTYHNLSGGIVALHKGYKF